jgi:polysaccharide deacetylase family protein (PEP-CTERM system associated)
MNTINPINQDRSKYFLITIDAEDWFHVENFKSLIPFETWNHRELRIEGNVHRLLDLFDSIKLPPTRRSTTSAPKPINPNNPKNATNPTNTINARKPRATFFVLCWIAERVPHIVREIAARGHEVASHGCYHELPKKMASDSLFMELKDSRKRLEDTIGGPVTGFRAPSFAIDDGILEAVAKSGYLFDSSYNSFSLHGRYGKISLNGQPKIGIARRVIDNFYELPISNINLFGSVLPLGGGAYFRLFPFRLFRLGVKSILKRDNAYLFYIHPWEIDPKQPRMTEASWNHKLRHYTMLSKTYGRLGKIIDAFKHCHFTTCSQYLDAQDAGMVISGAN